MENDCFKNYQDEDLEFANQILTNRKLLNHAQVDEWMKNPQHVQLLDDLAAVYRLHIQKDFSAVKQEEFIRIKESFRKKKHTFKFPIYWVVAASVLFLLGFFYTYYIYDGRDMEYKPVAVEYIQPGMKAELLLSTGERVVLNKETEWIAGQNEQGIRHNAEVGLDYAEAKVQVQGEKPVYNTVSTPKGGFYLLALSDGSKVWVNAETKLRFPVKFVGEDRTVYLQGEAYFDVAYDAVRPFCVKTNCGVDVKVHGTEFNVNTYHPGKVQTVLVSGVVGMQSEENLQEKILSPGQMAVYTEDDGNIKVSQVDIYNYVAWKDGEFVFERQTIEEIMNRLGRWYDIKVTYADESLKHHRFTGSISRYEEVEQVLRLIESAATLHFTIDRNHVHVEKGH